MRASTSGADASAEQVALRAALVAEVAGLAGRALVDGDRAWRAWRDGGDRSDRLAGAPGGLTAGIGAEASSAGWERKAWLQIGQAIVRSSLCDGASGMTSLRRRGARVFG